MNRQEYEYLQDRLTRLMRKHFELSRNVQEGFEKGVLAAKSLLKDVFEHQEEGERR